MPATAKSAANNSDKNSLGSSSSSLIDSTISAYAKKVATVCAMHGVPCGSASNLGTFMRALDNDKLLAMNFWSLVVKITDQLSEHEIGSNQPLLEAIARGVTRHSVAEVEAAGGEPKWLIQQMAAMLAGEDVHIPPAGAVPAPPIVETPRVAPAPPAFVLTPPAEAPVSTEAQSQPFLIRSRMILEPEAAASQPSLGQRALFAPEQKQAQEKPQPSRVPLEGYGERIATGSTSTRTIAFALLMMVALGGAAFFARGEGPALQQRVATSVRASYNAAWHGVKSLGSAIHQY
jgi:hypothetical protein